MADVNANIHIGIDASSAVGQLRALESQISAFNNSVVRSNAAAAATQKQLVDTLKAQIGATGQFNVSTRTMESGIASLGTAFDKGTLSARQYFRYAASQMPGLTKAFRSLGTEQAQMAALAEDRVKRLQTRYVSLGKDIHGMQQVMAIQPKNLASGYATDLALAEQKQQLFNRSLQLGSTGLVNWGKNTQWAGRQLMVGFTVPMTIAAGAAAKFFMELDKSSVAFKRVYGDMNTTTQETQKNLDAIKALGGEYTKYGLAVNEVIDIGARAAATGAQNEDLLAATEQTLRLATLGQTDYQTALDATISLQTAFGISSKQLGTTIDFLNAVENQTVLTLDDMARAVPRVAPVIKGLGGDVQDLAVFMTALREGGVSAEQGANALKSGLASLINPTDRASETLKKMGINIKAIVDTNRGDLMGTVRAFGMALDSLSEFERQQALETVFGKYQYARLGALFKNIARDGSQAARAMDLAGMSVQDLAALSEQELSVVSESVTNKFLGAVERLKVAIAPIGEMFLKVATPIIEVVTKIADKFNELPDNVKTVIAAVVGAIGLIAPALLMGVGLIGNAIGNGLKFILALRGGIKGLVGVLTGSSASFQYQAGSALDAAAAANTLDGAVVGLTGDLLIQQGAVNALAAAYGDMAGAARAAAASMPTGFPRPTMGGPRVVRRAFGGPIPGSGNGDTVPALLTPGEFVMTKEATQQYGPVLAAMNAGTVRGFAQGGGVSQSENLRAMALEFSHVAEKVELTDRQIQELMTHLEQVGETGSKAYRELNRVMQEAPAREAAGGRREKIYGYTNVGVPLRGDINYALGPGGGAQPSQVASAVRQSGAGSAAGIIDILTQRGIILDEQEQQRFADAFSTSFANEIDKLPEETITDRSLSEPFRKAIDSASTTLRTEVANQAKTIIEQEMNNITTIVSESGQAHGGTGRAAISQGRGNKRIAGKITSYISRRKYLAPIFSRLMGGKTMQEVAAEGVATGATTASPSEATRQTGEDVDQGIIDGMQAKEGEVKAQGEKVGKAAVESVQQAADQQQLSLFDQNLQPNLPQQEQLQLFDPNNLANTELEAAQKRLIEATNAEAAARQRAQQASDEITRHKEQMLNIDKSYAQDQKRGLELIRTGGQQTPEFQAIRERLTNNPEYVQDMRRLEELNQNRDRATAELTAAEQQLADSTKEATRLQEQNNAATKQNTEAKEKETQVTQAGAKVPPKGPPGQPPTGQPPAGEPVPQGKPIGDVSKQSKTLADRMRGVSGKLFGVSAAFTGLTIAGSFMEGQIGEVANSLMPFSFGLDAITGLIPMLTSPMGIAIAAFAAVGAALWYTNKQMNDIREQAQQFADALTTSAAEVNKVGEYFGNQSLVERQQILDVAQRAGVKSKDVAAGLEFIGSDIGQQMATEFSMALERQGGSQSVQTFANKLASMMMQGAIDFGQAEQIAAGLAQQLGQPEISAKIIGQLQRIVGPDGKDITKRPLQIAADIITNEKKTVDTLITPTMNAFDKAMSKETLNKTGMMAIFSGWPLIANVITNMGIDIPYVTDLSKNLMSTIDEGFANATASAQTYGKAVGNSLGNAYDTLNSAIIRNQKLIKDARKEDKPELRKRAILEEARIRKQISDIQQTAENNFAGLVQKNAALSKETLDGLQVSLKEMYKDPAMQMILENIFAATGGLDQTVRFNLLTSLKTGDLNPQAFNSMLDLIGDPTAAAVTLNLLVKSNGLDQTNKFLMENLQLGDQTVRKELLIRYTAETNPQAAADLAGLTNDKRSQLLNEATAAQEKYNTALDQWKRGVGEFASADMQGDAGYQLLMAYEKAANDAAGAVLDFDAARKKILESGGNKPLPEAKTIPSQLYGPQDKSMFSASTATAQKYKQVLEDLASINIKPKVQLDIDKTSEEDLSKITKAFNQYLELPPSVQKAINIDDVQANATMEQFDVNWKKMDSFKEIFKTIGVDASGANAVMAQFGVDWATFNNLPDLVKRMVMEYITVYQTVQAGADWQNANAGSYWSSGQATGAGMVANETQANIDAATAPYAPGATTTTPPGGGGTGGGGGGGGGGETAKTGADLVKEMLDQLRLQLKFLGDYKKVGDEVKSGLAEALRNAGAPEQLIADIISKGADGIKIAKELLKDKAKKLKELTALTLEVTRLTFVEQQRAEAANLAAQTKAQMALANTGISPEIAANLSTENAQAVAAAYQAYQAAQRKADAAEEKSKEKRKQANKELEKTRKNWEQVTTAIKQNTAEQEKNAIAQAILAAKQENINNQNRIRAALVLAGRGFTATDIAGVTENQAVSNQIVSYTDKLRQLQAEKAKLEAKGKKNWSEEERKRYKVLNKDIEKTRKEYEKLILDIKTLSAEQKKSLVSGTTIGFGVAAINAKNQREAITSLLGMKDKNGNPLYTFDQASSIAGNEQDAAAIISANQRVVDANKAMSDYVAKGGKKGTAEWRRLQKEINEATRAQNELNASIAQMTKEQQALSFQSVQENFRKEIVAQKNKQKFVQAGIADQLMLNKLMGMSIEDQNYFLTLLKENPKAAQEFLTVIEQSIPLSEKLAAAFERISAAQQLQSLINEKLADQNKEIGKTKDQLEQEAKTLNNQLQIQNDLLKIQQDKIKVIEEENNDYNRGLELLSRQEEAINKAFDDRLTALDKVQQANDRIAQQQQNQLNLSQALAQGDIYAATQAAQQIKQDNASASIENTRAALEEARTNALKNLTVDINGELLTRDEIEKRILSNNDRIYQINENQIEPIQAVIDSLNEQLDAVGRLQQKWEDYYKFLEDTATDPITGLKYKDLQKLKQFYDAYYAVQKESEKDAAKALQDAITATGINIDTGTFFTKFGINPNVGVQPTDPTQPGGATTQDVTTAREEAIKALPEVQKVLDTAKAIKTTFIEIPAEITKFVKSLVDNAQPAITGLTKYIKDTFAPTVETVKDKFVRMEQAVTKINDTLPLIDKFIPILVKTLQEKLVDIITGISNKVDNIHTKSKDLSTFYGNAAAAAQSLATALRAAAAAAAALAAAQSGGGSQDDGKKQNPPQKKPRFSGGVIPGGIPRDSVPIMASPGEFVVRNAMVDKYGMPLLNSINQGSFDPTFRTPSSNNYGNVTRNIDTNNSSTMYNNNYSISVTANTNANADDIATATVMKIRQLNSMQIRGARG